MSRKDIGIAGFLGITAIAIFWEIWNSVDNNPDTYPWTDLIVKYIPGELTGFIIGGLILWLPLHFGLRYYDKIKAPKADEDRTDQL